MKNVLVFFGGKSVEHDISIITGVLCANSLDKVAYNPIPIYITKEGKWVTGEELLDISNYKDNNFKTLKEVTLLSGSNKIYFVKKNKLKTFGEAYIAVNCMHGVNGEDGSLIGALKMCNVPFISPDIFSSSTFIDKDYTKIFLSGINVDKLPYLRIFRRVFYENKQTAVKMIEKKFDYPVIIKPATLGSSIGINIASNSKELLSFLDVAFLYDDKVIVEKALTDFKEINSAAYKYKDKIIVSECEEPITKNALLSFDDKYLGYKTGSNRKMPADIPKNISAQIKATTEKIYRKADFSGIIRVDYILKDNKIFVNEINTVPGSLAYYLFCDTIKDFSKLLSNLIEEGYNKHRLYKKRKFLYNSSVLNGIEGSKGGKVKAFDKKN